jgi:3-methylcrotonyl-CoA carboxylase alpha subunit
MKPLLIRRVLVANRGEIACRILRTLKAMGIASVAVHSDIDRQARHSREADSRVGLGGSESRDNYLAIDKIVAAALTSGAQAIHPGYGFLSENADFARAIEAAGLVFIGHRRRPSTPWAARRPPRR